MTRYQKPFESPQRQLQQHDKHEEHAFGSPLDVLVIAQWSNLYEMPTGDR